MTPSVQCQLRERDLSLPFSQQCGWKSSTSIQPAKAYEDDFVWRFCSQLCLDFSRVPYCMHADSLDVAVSGVNGCRSNYDCTAVEGESRPDCVHRLANVLSSKFFRKSPSSKPEVISLLGNLQNSKTLSCPQRGISDLRGSGCRQNLSQTVRSPNGGLKILERHFPTLCISAGNAAASVGKAFQGDGAVGKIFSPEGSAGKAFVQKLWPC